MSCTTPGISPAGSVQSESLQLRAMLFDVDGTLADTETLGHLPAYNEAFRDIGVNFRWSVELYRQLLTLPGGKERLLYFIQMYRPDLGEQADAVAADKHGWVQKVHNLKAAYFSQYLREGRVPLRNGIARLIDSCRSAGVKVALVSNASNESIDAVLSELLPDEIASKIDLVVSGCDVAAKKPAPDSYLHAIKRLGLEPWQCAALEDSSQGLTAAVSAQVTTVITRNGNTLDDDFSRASLVLEDLGEPGKPAQVVKGRIAGGCLTLADINALLPVPQQLKAA